MNIIIQLIFKKGIKSYIKLGSIKTEPNKGKHNYNLSLTFNTLEDEDIPDEYKSSIIPVCGRIYKYVSDKRKV